MVRIKSLVLRIAKLCGVFRDLIALGKERFSESPANTHEATTEKATAS